MEKILLITDSSSDIPKQFEEELNIKILCMPITINGESFFDRLSFTPNEFFQILNENEEIPVTSHITAPVFAEEFYNAYKQGYTDVIYVSINQYGSSTYHASLQGKELLYEEYPETVGKINIYSIASNTFSMGYGVPVIKAAEMIKSGKYNADEIVNLIEKMLSEFDICFSMFTLKFAKKSGRLSATSAIVGEMLGIRPTITFREGKNVILNKVRGDKSVVPAIADYYFKNKLDNDNEYFIIMGEDEEPAKELEEIICKQTGTKAKFIYKEGSCIAINAGPKIIGIGFVNKNKNQK